MPIFFYRARDRTGKLHLGKKEGKDRGEILAFVRAQDFLPISIKRQSDALLFFRKLLKSDIVQKKVKPSETIYFLRELGGMLQAGITLLTALGMIVAESKHPTLTKALKQVIEDVEEGNSLSDSIAKHPHIFDRVAVNVIKAGELGGNIGEALGQLADLIEYDEKNREKVLNVTRYPKIVAVVIVLALIVLFSFVLPRFTTLFEQVGATLPLPTRILLKMHSILLTYWYYILGLLLIGYFLLRRYIKTERGAYWWGGIILRIPILGTLSLRLSIARFARFFGTLYRFGIPVIQSIEIVHPIIGNPVMARAVKNLEKPLREGKRLNEAFAEQKLFPPFVVQLISVGEASGDISGVLEKLSKHYSEEVERSITRLTALLEPILIVGVGAVVLFLALSVYLPLWSIYRAASPSGQ